ncbi:hypothetical protein [Microbacterium sp. GXF7504]
MDKRLYPIRHDLSAALAHIEDAREMYPDGPVVCALDALQDAVSRLTDLVQEQLDPPRPSARRVR